MIFFKNNIFFLLLALCLAQVSFTVSAQQKKKRFQPDRTYIESYPSYLSIGVFTITPSINYKINSETKEAQNKNVESNFRANISNILGFTVGYRGINVAIGFKVTSNDQKGQKYAPSSYNSIGIRYRHPVYFLSFKYSKLKGLTDLNEANNLDTTSQYLRRGDIGITDYQLEGVYNISWKKYSYTAPLTFLQRQLKSRIGFLIKAGVSYSEITADSGLVTKRQSVFYDQFNDVKKLSGVSIKVAPGIGGNLVFFKRIYLSAAVFLAYDLYLYKYTRFSGEEAKSGKSFVVVLDGRASLGYQSERFYIGVRYEGDSRGAKFEHVRTTLQQGYFGIEVGYRFKAPKPLKKAFDKVLGS